MCVDLFTLNTRTTRMPIEMTKSKVRWWTTLRCESKMCGQMHTYTNFILRSTISKSIRKSARTQIFILCNDVGDVHDALWWWSYSMSLLICGSYCGGPFVPVVMSNTHTLRLNIVRDKKSMLCVCIKTPTRVYFFFFC